MDVEDDDNASSKHDVNTKKRHLPITPHPPSSVKPQPPSRHLKRPHTAGDFRNRRYRQRSVEEPVQFVNTSYHTNTGSDERKLESQLDSRQPDHLIDVNGQHQDTHSLKGPVHDSEHIEKKPLKKYVISQNQPVIVTYLMSITTIMPVLRISAGYPIHPLIQRIQ